MSLGHIIQYQKTRKYTKNDGDTQRGRGQLEGTLAGKIWVNLIIKENIIVIDYNPFNKVGNHEPILTFKDKL